MVPGAHSGARWGNAGMARLYWHTGLRSAGIGIPTVSCGWLSPGEGGGWELEVLLLDAGVKQCRLQPEGETVSGRVRNSHSDVQSRSGPSCSSAGKPVPHSLSSQAGHN